MGGCVCYLLGARYGDVDDSGRLFQLEIGDESLSEVVRLLQDVHGVSAAGQCQQDAVLLLHLDLAGHAFQLLLFQSHPLGDPQREGDAVGTAGQRSSRHQRIARNKVHLDDGVVVLETHQTLPHDGIALQEHHQRIGLRRRTALLLLLSGQGAGRRGRRQRRSFRSRRGRGVAPNSASSSSSSSSQVGGRRRRSVVAVGQVFRRQQRVRGRGRGGQVRLTVLRRRGRG